MPTTLLRWDPDLQPDSWSSDEPLRGSALRARDQLDMLHSLNQTTALLNIDGKVILFLPWAKNTGELQFSCPV